MGLDAGPALVGPGLGPVGHVVDGARRAHGDGRGEGGAAGEDQTAANRVRRRGRRRRSGEEPAGRGTEHAEALGQAPLAHRREGGARHVLDGPGQRRGEDAGAEEDGQEDVGVAGLVADPPEVVTGRRRGTGDGVAHRRLVVVGAGRRSAGEVVEAGLDRSEPVDDHHRDEHELDGDEEEAGDDRPVPLPSHQVHDRVGPAHEAHREGEGEDEPPHRIALPVGWSRTSTAPVRPSTTTTSPRETRDRTLRCPTTTGTPCSRARIARWESGLPVSATRPASDGRSGARPGSRVRTTRTSPTAGSSNTTRPLPRPPPAPTPPRRSCPSATTTPAADSRNVAGSGVTGADGAAPATAMPSRASAQLGPPEVGHVGAEEGPPVLQPSAELADERARELVDPAHPQAEGLADGQIARDPGHGGTDVGERVSLGQRGRGQRQGDRRAGDDVVVGPPERSAGGHGSHRRLGAGAPQVVEQRAGEHLVAVEAAQVARGPIEAAQQLCVGQGTWRRHGVEGAVDLDQELGRERRHRPAQPADPPGDDQATKVRPGVERPPGAAPGRSVAEELQVGDDLVVHDEDHRRPPQPAAGGRAREAQDVGHRIGERLDPEVLLEPAQGVGEGLGHRAGPEQRAGADRGDGGDRSALQEHRPVPVQRPLDVLGPAEARAGPDVRGPAAAAGRRRRGPAPGRRRCRGPDRCGPRRSGGPPPRRPPAGADPPPPPR